jgi:small subunit ribosomal protein S16
MLAISLMRMGAKKRPFYRVVVKEKRSKRDGAYLENLGTYDPLQDPAEVKLNHDRIQYWIGVGAKPTDTVASLIKNNPAMTDEERDAMLAARAEKKAAVDAERAAARRAEEERLAAEAAEKEAADKAAAEAAAAEAAAEAAPASEETVEASGEETPAADAPVEAAADETPAAQVEAAPAEDAAAATEEAPAEEGQAA